MDLSVGQKAFLKKIVPFSAFVGGLCCFSSVVLVLFGLSSVAFAASLSDFLYYQHKWGFRAIALLFLLAGLVWYFYKKEGICTLDDIKREHKRIINVLLVSILSLVLAYIIWLYVIVEILGILLGIWGVPNADSLGQIF